jgi:hypothetical protein
MCQPDAASEISQRPHLAGQEHPPPQVRPSHSSEQVLIRARSRERNGTVDEDTCSASATDWSVRDPKFGIGSLSLWVRTFVHGTVDLRTSAKRKPDIITTNDHPFYVLTDLPGPVRWQAAYAFSWRRSCRPRLPSLPT